MRARPSKNPNHARVVPQAAMTVASSLRTVFPDAKCGDSHRGRRKLRKHARGAARAVRDEPKH
eukprot:6236618-Pyramimonas_sp.AAC.1